MLPNRLGELLELLGIPNREPPVSAEGRMEDALQVAPFEAPNRLPAAVADAVDPKRFPGRIRGAELKSPLDLVELKIPVGVGVLKSPVGAVELKSSVGVVELKSPVGVVVLKSPWEVEVEGEFLNNDPAVEPTKLGENWNAPVDDLPRSVPNRPPPPTGFADRLSDKEPVPKGLAELACWPTRSQ